MKVIDRNILCISNPTWEGDYAKTIVELMTLFSKSNKVLYVDYQFTLKDVAFTLLRKANAPVKRMYGIEPNLREYSLGENHSVFLLTPPPIIPINFLPGGIVYRSLLKWNAGIVRNSVKKALSLLNMEEELIVIDAFNPGMGLPNFGKFDESIHLYHCYDEIGAAVWAKKHGADLEKQYMPLVDGVITTSDGLYQKKKEWAKKCFLVRNGVNFELFNQGFNPTIKEHKIIGYIGSIDNRLDYDILTHLFTSLPNHEFHFVGRIMYSKGEQILKEFSNVKLLGAKPVSELPSILKQFSMGLIPFVKNEFTQGIYPLKINEYLAAGLPVVMTPFSDLSEFHSTVGVANSPDSFLEEVNRELADDTAEKRRKRTEIAKTNSWQGRVKEIAEIIVRLEEEKAK